MSSAKHPLSRAIEGERLANTAPREVRTVGRLNPPGRLPAREPGIATGKALPRQPPPGPVDAGDPLHFSSHFPTLRLAPQLAAHGQYGAPQNHHNSGALPG